MNAAIETPLKLCPHCQEWKPATPEFFHVRRSDGRFHPMCRVCSAAIIADEAARRVERAEADGTIDLDELERAQRKAIRAAIEATPELKAQQEAENLKAKREYGRVHARQWYAANTEKALAYRIANRERIAAYSRAWYEKRRGGYAKRYKSARPYPKGVDKRIEKAARDRAYRAAHPEKGRAHAARYSATKRRLPIFWTSEMEAQMYAAWDHRCAYCGRDLHEPDAYPQVDHYIPLAKKFHCPGTVRWNHVPACKACNTNKRDHMPEPWIKSRFPERAEVIIDAIARYFATVAPSRTERRAATRQAKQLTLPID